jgi:hypothetical protein
VLKAEPDADEGFMLHECLKVEDLVTDNTLSTLFDSESVRKMALFSPAFSFSFSLAIL